MLKLHDMLGTSIDFFRAGIWQFDDGNQTWWRSAVIKPLRVIVLTIHGFIINKCAVQASALTYYTLLAVVPVLAMVLGVARGFGLDSHLEKLLYERLAGQEETINWIITISRNLLQNTRGGVIAGIGVALLFWSALKVLGRVEAALNQIWKVSSRTVIRKFTDYLSILIIGPFLLVISSSINIYISAHMVEIAKEVVILRMASPLLFFMLKFVPYCLAWLLFTVVFIVIPNVRVKLMSAAIGGLIAGVIFQLMQGGYIYTQLLLSRYNAIYGSFAALPLLLIWMQLSWIIVLFGAQLAYAHQHVGLHAMAVDYDQSSRYLRYKYALYLFWALVKRFKDGNAPTVSQLAEELDLPYALVSQVLEPLIAAELVSTVVRHDDDEYGYQPAMDPHAFTLADFLQALDRTGVEELPKNSGRELEQISLVLDDFTREIQKSKGNVVVKNI